MSSIQRPDTALLGCAHTPAQAKPAETFSMWILRDEHGSNCDRLQRLNQTFLGLLPCPQPRTACAITLQAGLRSVSILLRSIHTRMFRCIYLQIIAGASCLSYVHASERVHVTKSALHQTVLFSSLLFLPQKTLRSVLASAGEAPRGD